MSYLLLLGPLIGAILYRMRGGWPDIPRPIEQALFCSVFIYLMWGLPWLTIAIAYALAVIATLKGHGRNMALFTRKETASPEWYEWIIAPLDGKIPLYWYNALGMSISGLSITIAPALALLIYGHSWGVIVLISGLLKGLAYILGWTNILPKIKMGKFELNHETAWGEFLTGFFIWLTILIKWKKK